MDVSLIEATVSIDLTNPQLSPGQIAHDAMWKDPPHPGFVVCGSESYPDYLWLEQGNDQIRVLPRSAGDGERRAIILALLEYRRGLPCQVSPMR